VAENSRNSVASVGLATSASSPTSPVSSTSPVSTTSLVSTTSPALAASTPGALRSQTRARRRSEKRSNYGRTLRRAIGVGALVAAWEAYSRISENRLVPNVSFIWTALRESFSSGDLWFHGRLTLFRSTTGLAIALCLGVLFGFLLGTNRWFRSAFAPIFSATYPAPKLALYPVFILLFGLGGTSKVLLVAVECFYPVVFNVAAGAQGISRDFMWHAYNVEASLWRRVKDLILPSTLPAILTGLRIAAPLMLVVEVVTEMIGESRGLGFMIMDARSRFDPPTVFAVIVVLALGGYFLDRIVQLLTRQLVFWERDVRI
jgi:ABC-type nitrate/sulfonate/bicarbonate transport system permease component